ncbi:MAG: discoidin domain-containing protein [Bacteroidaceae bacterium]|nr:discoidin domain-containing protein [Bacteroidaceae bacterium]
MKRTRILLTLAALTFAATLTLSAQDEPRTAYMVADAHLDTQWNWDIQTTIREYIPKTIRQNLHLLRNYPDYIFNFEGAIKYSWMKEYYPTEYEEVKKYIAQGRWHLTGASWDANETVIVSPESWLRNTLLGQTFYRNEYGQESTDIFLPDCFGFAYTLPTLAAHCGLIGFSSQKLGWRTNRFFEGQLARYPFSVGLWQGIDGSRIMMAHGYSYGQTYPDSDLSENTRLLREMNESTVPVGYRYYGTGDTGGSPTIESVRAVMKGMKGNGPVTIKSATSDQLYKDYLPFSAHPELPVFDGELYMDVHGTGCYTSQAAMKFYNRQNEHLADAAERASVVSEWLGTAAYPSERITDAWHRVILHQFHDDLPGTSIPRAYEFSWNDELIALSQYASVLTHAVSGVASQLNTDVSGIPVVLHNTEAFAQKAIADMVMPDGAAAYTVTGPDGKRALSQVVTDSQGKKHLLVDANVPGVGFAVYGVKPASAGKAFVERDVREVENSVYSLRFDANGDISSLIDKRTGRELVRQGEAIGLVIFDDCRSEAWPAWEILKHTVDKAPLKITDGVSVRLVEDGAIRTTVRVTKQYGKSTFNQYIHLYKGTQAERIDFQCEVDWHSTHSLLKANFPLAISNPDATYDLGLGSVKRGNNRDNQYEVYSHEWTDLTDSSGAYGVTIYNNCKYGWDKPNDNTIRLSLLWAPQPGGGYRYQENQDMGWHTFTYCLEGHSGDVNKADAVAHSTMVNSPLRAFTAPKHKGTLGRSFGFASSDNANITVRALKKAEMGNEYVVRVYENSGKGSQQGTITFGAPIAKAVEADGTEKPLGAASFSGNGLNVNIGAFSVKTYRITFAGQPTLTELPQQPLALPFNKRCFSFNEFRRGASFEGSNSYAAELLPADGIITSGDVRFVLGEKDGFNGFSLGDTIALPAGIYNKVYLLAASVRGDSQYKVGILSQKGKKEVLSEVEVSVPNYTGFIGQWGHDGHTQPFFKDADIAYIGTHRHSSTEDEPFEYTYMFRVGIDLPAGAKAIILPGGPKIEPTAEPTQQIPTRFGRRAMPRESNVVVFAATAVNEGAPVVPAGSLFNTGSKTNEATVARVQKPNLLSGATILATTGEVNEREKASNLIDGNLNTKWCDTNDAPNFTSFDLGTAKTIAAWRLVNAGKESNSYITRSCLLQGRNSLTEEWKTLDLLDGNKSDDVDRSFTPTSVRYLRIFVTGPTQDVGDDTVRIYELEVYGE